MGWNTFSSTSKELTNSVSGTPLIYDLLGDNKIIAESHKTIVFQGVEKLIECSAEKQIQIKAPNFMSKDGKFFRTNDAQGKFLDIREEDTNG